MVGGISLIWAIPMAAKTATLDIMSDGRGDVGVGRAGNPYQLEPFGVKLEDTRGIWA